MAAFDQQKKQAAEHYSTLTDEELKELADEAWSLTDPGQKALQDELARRALEFALALTPPPQIPPLDLVIVARFRDTPDALLAQSALESAGLECFLIDETTIRMDWLWSNALGRIKVSVRREDAEAAAQILGRRIPETFGVEGVGEFEQPHCPKCQSLDISYEDLDKRIAYAGMLLVGFPVPIKRCKWTCQTCGNEWRSDDEAKQES